MDVGKPPDLPRIDRLWAFVAVDDDGDEGLCAFQAANGWMPMVAADIARVESLKQIAQMIVNEGEGTVKLVRFSAREELEVFEKIHEAEVVEECGVLRKSWMEAEADGPACNLPAGHVGKHDYE